MAPQSIMRPTSSSAAHLKHSIINNLPTSSTSPLIISAPMRLISGPKLALAVSQAGGLGFIGAGTDVSSLASDLSQCIAAHQFAPSTQYPGILRVGVGFICWGADLPTVLATIKEAELKPTAAWLFAPKDAQDLQAWADGIRDASGGKTQIWVQVGTVKMCVEVAKLCAPDVLVIQGADAGGHGLAQSSSIISLLPECADALKASGFQTTPLIAAGGIVEGRGVAAATMLGASGVCMGTRFLASNEATISRGYQAAVLAARDGGVSTARTGLYDQLRGTLGWPPQYNGRGVLNRSFWDDAAGLGEDENRTLYERAVACGDAGWGEQGRMTTYAGTGVGLVGKVMPAGEIVDEVLREYATAIGRTSNET